MNLNYKLVLRSQKWNVIEVQDLWNKCKHNNSVFSAT